jgi:hypothetical protein
MSQRHAPATFYPRERPGTHCTGGWVGPSAGLDRCGKSRPHRDSIPGPSSPVASQLAKFVIVVYQVFTTQGIIRKIVHLHVVKLCSTNRPAGLLK